MKKKLDDKKIADLNRELNGDLERLLKAGEDKKEAIEFLLKRRGME